MRSYYRQEMMIQNCKFAVLILKSNSSDITDPEYQLEKEKCRLEKLSKVKENVNLLKIIRFRSKTSSTMRLKNLLKSS